MTPQKPLLFSVPIKEKVFLAKHLAVMVRAGIPLRDALTALNEQAESPSLRYVLTNCISDLEGGQVLAHCLAKFPRVFDPFFSNVVSVGEASGTLADSLHYLATQLEKSRELNSKVRSALIYPVIVFVGAIGIGTYLAFFLLPKLVPLFVSLGGNLPITTRFLLASTALIRAHGSWALGGLLVIVLGLALLWRIERVRKTAHGFVLHLPALGQLIRQIQVAQFSRILGTLLTAGVKLVPALRITANSIGNLIYRQELMAIADWTERGRTIAAGLKARPKLFDRTVVSMMHVGENTGKLSEGLLSLATFTEGEVDHDVKNLSSLIEPIVLLIVGVIVGFVALSVISPIYQLTQSIGR